MGGGNRKERTNSRHGRVKTEFGGKLLGDGVGRHDDGIQLPVGVVRMSFKSGNSGGTTALEE